MSRPMPPRVLKRSLAAVGLVLVAASCAPEAQAITPEDLAAHLAEGKAGTGFNLVDLRSDVAYAGLHLPGAVSIPYERLSADRLLFLDGRPVIFYDDGEPDVARLSRALGERLPTNVVVLEGGMQAWLTARLPVERGAS